MAGTMRESWDASADDWIRWARSPEHDHFFWRFTRPALLELLPPPGRLTVDLGCGEGRLARELQQRGHRVIGIEASERLAAAARAAVPPTEVIVADAAALPLDDSQADLVVASMSLLNIDDLSGAVAELSRVLGPGGRFCFATVHPFNSIGAARSILGDGGYFDELRFAETRERKGVRMTFHDVHRPLRDLCGALEQAGLLLEAVREPIPDDDYVAAHPEVRRWRRDPCFLHGRAIKPGADAAAAPSGR